MGRRDLSPAGKRPRAGVPGDVASAASAPPVGVPSAHLLLECTRAVLRARDQAELARGVETLLTQSGEYAQASIVFGAPLPAQTPDAGPAIEPAPTHRLVLPLSVAGQPIASFELRTSGERVPGEAELAQLRALADDLSFAIGRLQRDAQRRSVAASERRLRETFEHAGVGITRVGADGRFIEVNQKFCDMLGYTRDELIGRPTIEVTVPGDYGGGAASRAQALLDGKSLSIAEKRYLRKDGTPLWVRRTMSPADDDGKVHDVISIVEDVTQRKLAQEGLASEHTLLRTIIDALPHYIYVKGKDGRITIANQSWLEARGLTMSQVRGKTVHDIFPPDIARHMETQERVILDSGEELIDVEQHVVFTKPDGSAHDRWSLTTKVPLRESDGTIIGVVGISRDMTERKRIERELREYVERFELAARATSDVIWDWDFNSGTLWWGEGIEQLFQCRREEIGPTIESWTSRIDPAEVHAIEAGVDQAVNGDASFWSADYRFRRADGSYADVYDRAFIMRDERGKAVRMIGAMMDMSQRKRAERERAMEHAVSQVLSQSRSVEETLPRLISTICAAMGWAYGARWVWDRETAKLRRAEWWSDRELDFDAADRHYWLELGPAYAGGLLLRAWFEERPTWLTDIDVEPSFRRRPSAARLGFRSAYAFPILAHDERVGVMEFFGREVREPDEALLQVTAAVASQIGQFIRRKQAEDSLQESEQQLRAMFENADVGISVTSLDLRYLRVNDKYCSIVGYTREEMLALRVPDLNLPENVAPLTEYRETVIAGAAAHQTREKQLVCKDGELIWVSMAISLVRAADDSPRYFIAVIQDISENKRAAAALKESEEQFRRLAHYDSLTRLPNRSLFYDRLAHGIAQARRNVWTLAVLFIDVDRFKHVNDTFGHTAGDQLLKQVSERLSECVRSDDTVGRLSGDEFAIVLSRVAAPEDAATVAQKIVDELNLPFQLEGAELFVTASIGITVYPNDSEEQDALIRNADVAMYRAKERGRNNYQFYTPEMNRRTREMLNMEGELRRALERDEFVMHYQPKVSLATGQITGVEALLRWRHPERGLVPPGDFIPLLEETGLIVQAGERVLDLVCEQINCWEREGIEPLPVAVNLSARQFLAPDLAGSIRRVLEAHHVNPGLLEVEITESAIMTNADEAIRTLETLEALGVKTSVDDFGTGYSSLGYLKRFPLYALKIDRSFVRDITTDPDDATITQAVISMAHSLQLKVIAEGVETEAQLEFLERYGCDEVQGFLYSKPIPGDECGAMIAEDGRFRKG
jgi:diguanylate cyclase (GGDEF)-like protein/PAS domain S-box-containing protein